MVYDETKCMGCRYCMQACPFQVPVYEWGKLLPRVRKCDQCYDRQAAGKPTACSEACPTGATITGERGAMIAEARKRIAEKPKEYFQGIYGLAEVGGTSTFYIPRCPSNSSDCAPTCRRRPFRRSPGRRYRLCPTS